MRDEVMNVRCIMTDPISGSQSNPAYSQQASMDSSGASGDQAQYLAQYLTMQQEIQQYIDASNAQQSDDLQAVGMQDPAQLGQQHYAAFESAVNALPQYQG